GRRRPAGRARLAVPEGRARARQPLQARRPPSREDQSARLPDAPHHRHRRADGRELAPRAPAHAAAHPAQPDPAWALVGTAEGARRMTGARGAAAALGLLFAEAPPRLPARDLLAPLPMQYARRHLVLPLAREAERLEVAVADPHALAALDDLRLLYSARVDPLVVPAEVLREAISRAYDAAASAASEDGASLGARLELDATALDDAGEPPDLLEAGEDAPAIRLINAVLYEAVRAGASDIHIEPFERTPAVRLRVDGVLQALLAPPLRLHAALASRVKIMAGLDIAERRLPQDGRIALRVGGRDVDVRVSVVPTAAGERVVLRLLDRASVLRDVADLGIAPAARAGGDDLLRRTHGLLPGPG